MSLPLTKERLAAVYTCLRQFPPFDKWNLPHPIDVEFRVTRLATEEGHYNRYAGTNHHWIAISSKRIGHFDSLAVVMAHEMAHLAQAIARVETPNAQHNADFRRRAKQICRRFGFDYKTFI